MMKRFAFSLLLIITVASLGPTTSAQNNTTQQQTSNTIDLNTLLMESTFMLEGVNAQHQTVSGTTFIMGKPLPYQPGRAAYVLITAAHVFDAMQGDSAVLRLRHKVGENSFVDGPFPIMIRANGKPLWTSNPEADVAVMYVKIPQDAYIPLLSTGLLADDKTLSEYDVHPGDELECLGFPLGIDNGNRGAFPILRSGKIASYPLLPTSTTKTFLLDLRVLEGNSGGPVYMSQTTRFYGGSLRMGQFAFIAGMVTKEITSDTRVLGPYDTEIRRLPLDLAVVVDASLIKQTLDMLPPPAAN